MNPLCIGDWKESGNRNMKIIDELRIEKYKLGIGKLNLS
jgi:hypothetical protein